MEHDTSQTENKSTRQWASYGIIAVVAVILVIFLFNNAEQTSNSSERQSPTPNSELETAKDKALTNPSFLTYLNLGLLYYKTGEYQNCINITIKALEYPATPEKQAIAYNNLCSAYNVLNMPEEAIKAGEKAISLQPDFELAKNNLKAALSLKKKLSL